MTETKSSFQRWYEENKEKVAKQRKKRYEQDEEYRKKRLAEVKRYYWLKRRRAESVDAKRIDVDELELEPDELIPVVVTNENDIRKGMTVMVPVYRPAQVAEILDRSVQTLRLWGLKGLLPEVTYRAPGGVRLYTEDQYIVIVENRHLLEFSSKRFEDNPFFVAVRNGWEELEPDGIEVMDKSDWRFDPTVCPWCGSTPSLQKKNEDGYWESVPCFECKDPFEVEERIGEIETVVIRGECQACDSIIEKEQQVFGNTELVVRCPRCGRRVTDFRVE